MTEGARETSIRVRDGLLLLEEKERGRPATLIEELEAEADASLRMFQNLVDAMARQERLFLANEIDALLNNPAAQIPGKYSRARWLEIRKHFNRLKAFMYTPDEEGTTPIVVISRRGNPPEPTPDPAPEQAQVDAPPPDIVIVGEVEDVLVDGKKTKRGSK